MFKFLAIVGASALAGFLAITAAPALATSAGATGLLISGVSDKGFCLDVKNAFGKGAAGEQLQIWQCGAANAEDQVFTFINAPGTTGPGNEIQFKALSGGAFCITEGMAAAQLTLQPCAGTPDQLISKAPGTPGPIGLNSGNVMDVKASVAANGTPVISFSPNGNPNQSWTDPV